MTAREMIYSLPGRLKKDEVHDSALHRFHIKLDGEDGGNYTVTLKNKEVVILDGLVDEPTCTIKTSTKTFEDLETGKSNPVMLFMTGKVKVSNISEVLKFIEYFDTIHSK